MITEEQARERCEKYNLKFNKIHINGDYNSCRLYLTCTKCSRNIEYPYHGLNKRKTCLCKECIDNSYRLSNEVIINRLKEFGAYPVDISQYKVCTDVIDIRCKCGTIFKLRINDIPKCKDIICKKCRGYYTDEDIQEYCLLNNINLVEIDSNNRIKAKCKDCNILFTKSFRDLRIQKNPQLCRKCYFNYVEPKYNDIKTMDDWFKSNNLTADLSGYTGAKYKIPLICSCGNKFKRCWNSITSNNSILCPKCTNKQNYTERKLESLIKDFNEEWEINYRQLITPKEIDLYFPEKKLGIEINGSYWHSDILKDKHYHIEKTLEVEKKGSTLLHFFDFEIRNKPQIVQSMIGARLGKAKKIYARKCEVGGITAQAARRFFEKTHIQSSFPALFYYGLFYNNELVSCMSFGSPRFNSNYEYELIRFSNKLGYTVIGGASKLFSFFIKDKAPNSIISYANRRFSQGGLYSKLGFTFVQNSEPGYFYANGKDYVSRSRAQKHKLEKLLGEKFNEILSEYENMRNAGYFRIWDCGNLVYEWKKNENQYRGHPN